MPYSREYFSGWYAKNRQRLSEKRRERYQSDPELRKRMIENATRRRAETRKAPPDGYTHTFDRTSKELGVPVWTLREWRRKNYFPEPLEFGRGVYFTQNQILLMKKLAEFFQTHGPRLRALDRGELQKIVSLIYSNW